MGMTTPTPQQGWMYAETKSLAHADFTENDRLTGEDHAAHITGKTCKACGHAIEPRQDARRTGVADWVHDVCPEWPADRNEEDR
jgi:hypothetical protein